MSFLEVLDGGVDVFSRPLERALADHLVLIGDAVDLLSSLLHGSTYGPQGVTVAVRIGFDDNRALGEKETGGRTALPIFREIMLRVYERQLVGPAPSFPREIEDGIDRYLVRYARHPAVRDTPRPAPVEKPPVDQGPIGRQAGVH